MEIGSHETWKDQKLKNKVMRKRSGRVKGKEKRRQREKEENEKRKRGRLFIIITVSLSDDDDVKTAENLPIHPFG